MLMLAIGVLRIMGKTRVLADTFHMNIEEVSITDAIRARLRR